MPAYKQPTNPNSFKPKYRKYKQLRTDIWGNLAFLNKKNSFFQIMQKYAFLQLRRRLAKLRTKRARGLKRAFQLSKFRTPFEYSVKKRPETVLKRLPKFRYSLRLLRKKLIMFYGFRQRSKPLRKLFRKANRASQGRSLLFHNTRHTFPTPSKKVDLEARIDVILYRLNFIHTVYEGRRFIKEKRAFILKPSLKAPKFFYYYTVKKYFHKVPFFHFVSLRYDLALLRKVKLLNLVFASKLLSYPPDYLMVDYRTMIGLRHMPIVAHRVRYPFQGTLAYFIGLAIYY